MKRDYILFLKDIINAMEAIERFVEGMDLEAFIEDDKTSSAVIRKFEIIGEATKNIPDGIREKHPHIPWKRMAGLRDRLIHGYFGIDYKLVWEAIKVEIPKIKPELQKILKELKMG
ncbi:HepT-like ribonuclease domain-containing protein [Caldisericum sp.]|uniref:HepT-like ribonuclease domain-containing protein n=1 Tax=Caldisericum sp. TaxID=2499687 RepID=UPI003D1280F4